MKPAFSDYVRAAFNARPTGVFVPPNWIGLGVFGFLGVLNPGFWIIGLGCELAYLGWLGTHPRFQRLVDGRRLLDERRRWQERLYDLLRRLPQEDQQRYRALQSRCESIIDQQAGAAAVPAGVQEQSEGLARLMWIYLGLLPTRESIKKIMHESASSQEDASQQEIDQIEARIGKLQQRLKQPAVGEDLRKSLTGQIEILQQERPPRSLYSWRRSSRALSNRSTCCGSKRCCPPIRKSSRNASIKSPPRWVGPTSGYAISRRSMARWKIWSPNRRLSLSLGERNPNELSTTRLGRTDARPFQIRIGRPISHSWKYFRCRAY
ncbi:MAG: hypothetical protein DMG14_26430 [Acidobacteria bacterium]|nr:MAG: hypothetical protein DMG14_26430 [Acidobacteriota bacterium]